MADKNSKNQTAITPQRSEDFPQWYQNVVKEADMAEIAHVRGCMVIKPWGYGIWEKIQRAFDDMIKEKGVQNAYFPLFVPLSYIEKEAEHVDGFAKEMAVVTHHRLEKKDGKLVPAGELTEPVVVRPTSETIIGESFSSWIKSYRDLPIKINQWCNVVRWEMRPRVFLRTVEFLWQEGHTAFASEEEARQDASEMIDAYRDFSHNWLAIPVIQGAKPPYDKFPGATDTYAIEAMMQDGKALQAGTSHFLGQAFAKSADISFLDQDGQEKFAHTASWGVSTRLIGGLIMTHGDDNGLKLPPKIAPQHAVVIPILRGKDAEQDAAVEEYAKKVRKELSTCSFSEDNIPVNIQVDNRLIRGAEKKWQWVKKGIPLQLEVGPRDIESGNVVVRKRSDNPQDKTFMPLNELKENLPAILEEMQKLYFDQATELLNSNTVEVSSFEEMEKLFSSDDFKGFVKAPWKSCEIEDPRLKPMKITIRCIPFDQKGEERTCILTGEPTTEEAIFAKSY